MATLTPKPISPFRLSSLIRLQKDPTLAFQLFQNPNPTQNPRKPFRHSLLSYDLIITKLGRAKMFDQMEQVLLQLKQERRFVVPEFIFCDVISFYGRARLLARALQTFDSIPSFQCRRTIKSFNSLLDALLNCRELEKMKNFFLGVDKYGCPDACTYNILISACCINRNLEVAWHVFDEMQRKGVRPTVVTFGTLINGLCLDFRLEEAFELKEDMMRVFKVKPNAFLYTTLLKGICGTGDLSLAFRIKEEMVGHKIKLDTAVYNTLISALLKVGRKEEALGILEEMKNNGCKPNTVTYNAMINGFCGESNLEEAYRVLDEMAEKGCKPNVISYNVIIGRLCKEGKWSEANDLFQDMPRRGCSPDVVSYRTLFDGLCGWMQLKEAALILDEMIFKGYVPLRASINKFVNGLCHEGNTELLLEVLTSLGKVNILNVDTWTIMVSVVCEKEKPSKDFKLFDTLMMLEI